MALFEVRDLKVEILRLTGSSPYRKAKVKDVEAHLVIDGVSFDVEEGEALAIVGESASGKSLIAMGSIDLLAPGARVVDGATRFEGTVLQDLEEADWRRLVGMGLGVMFQNAIGSWDPLDFIGYQSGEGLMEHTELTDEEIADRVADALGEVRLEKRRFLRAFSHEMSRGQAQRAMLASALLASPRLLIADEPLSGLDVTTARSVMSLIEDLRTKRGMGMLLVTHDLAVVAAAADRVAVVYGGAIVEMASVEDVFARPQHPYTSGLLGSVPGFTRGRLRPIEGEPPDLWNLAPGCPFAPRCPYAVDRCRVEKPVLEAVGHTEVACHRAWELELPGVPA